MPSGTVILACQCWCKLCIKKLPILNQLICVQNGTTEEVKKIVATLNEGQVPSQDVVGESSSQLSI